MSFASLPFLFFFLPIFFTLYYTALGCRVSTRVLNGLALCASGLFYIWGAPRFVPVLLLSCIIDYFLSHRIAALPSTHSARRRLLAVSVLLNVGCLLYFKYANFFVEQTNVLLQVLGLGALEWTPVLLPIGISFITFEKLSYIFDVSRGKTDPAPSIVTFLLFIALFPHLIAGPIFRYHDLADQLVNRRHSLDLATSGMLRFVQGLAKKVLIADTLAVIADRVFALPPEALSPARAWFGILSYAYQIYFDFSGYSDMAIGLGRMMGFRFLENFDCPYISQNITEFWKRWHISLSNWLREYLYFPLGGNRISPVRTYLNLWIVFLVSGFWHGANWTFIVWGTFHGVFLMLDRLFLIELLSKTPRAVRTLITFVIVLSGWVLFRADSLPQAGMFLSHMFIPTSAVFEPNMPYLYELNSRVTVVFLVATAICFFPLLGEAATNLRRACAPSSGRWQFAICGTGALVFLVLAAASLVNSTFHPFIYFRF